MSESKVLLKLTAVSKRFSPPGGSEAVEVLRGIDLRLNRGESLAIIGPSGSGKSTLLNIVGTLDRPTSGRVTIDGEDLTGVDEDGLARIRNRRIGFVFQSHHLLPQCNVLENVLLPTIANADGASRSEAPDRARRLLDKVGLTPRLAHRPGQLSGGERQRVAVVRALINQPALLLADEPTGALDRASAATLADLLVRLNREEGVSLILVTHAMDLARRMAGVMELKDGTLRPLASDPGRA